MPKVNVYVTDEMLEWIRENNIKISAEFQTRIAQLQNGEPASDGSEVAKLVPIRTVRVINNKVKLKPTQTPLFAEYDDEGGITGLVVVQK